MATRKTMFSASLSRDDDQCTSKDTLCFYSRYTKSWYNKENQKLSAEINALRQSLADRRSIFYEPSKDIVNKLETRLPLRKQVLLRDINLQSESSSEGDVRVEWLKNFTGISIHRINVEYENRITNTKTRKHCISGTCYEIKFEVTFLVEEIVNGSPAEDTSTQESKISCLTIDICEQSAKHDMKDAILHFQDRKELMQFFVTFRHYTQMRQNRSKLFRYFCDKYFELVQMLNSESTMSICNVKYPLLRMDIVWIVKVTKQGEIYNDVDMVSFIPEELYHWDTSGVLQNLRLKFCNLITTIGIEKSIDVVIQIIAK